MGIETLHTSLGGLTGFGRDHMPCLAAWSLEKQRLSGESSGMGSSPGCTIHRLCALPAQSQFLTLARWP